MIGPREFLFASTFTFICGSFAPADPGRLRALVPGQRPRTAEIEWTLTSIGGLDNGLVERYQTHVTGEAILQKNFGDERGFHEYDLRRPPESRIPPEDLEKFVYPRERSAGTRSTLLHEGLIWDLPRVERPVVGSVGPAGNPSLRYPMDLSLIGLAPSWVTRASNPLHTADHLYDGISWGTFETGLEDGFRTVTAEYADKRLTWYFDDRRGGHPVRSILTYRNEMYLSETELNKVEGRWFPAEVRFYKHDSAQPYKIIEVSKATFDQPWHKQELTPRDLGALWGTQFTPRDQVATYFWDGEGLISTEEYDELVYGFGILPHEQVLQGIAESLGVTVNEHIRTHYQGPHVAGIRSFLQEQHLNKYHEEPPWLTTFKLTEKDAWDAYVEEFIAKHELAEPAVERAKKALERAKKLRDAFKYKIRIAEREGRKHDLERYKEREERIFKEILVRELERLAQAHPKKAPAPGAEDKR